MTRAAWCVVACALGAACGGDTFDPPSVLKGLRVLAVKADQPLARPGETVHLDALVVDPLGPRAVQMAWGTCVNPGSAEVPACAAQVSSFTAGGPSFDVVIPPDAIPAGAAVGEVGAIFVACAGTLRAERTPTAPLACVDANGRAVGETGFMWGEKRIAVATDGRNANPHIAQVELDEVPLGETDAPAVAPCDAAAVADCPPAERHALDVIATQDSAETYLGHTEDLVAFYFVTQGRVQDDFARAPSGSSRFDTVFAATRAAGEIEVVLVLRDDRGGVDWAVRRVIAR